MDQLLTKLNESKSALGFDVHSRSRPTMRRLAAVHARCHDFDVARREREGIQLTPPSPRATQIAPEEVPNVPKRQRSRSTSLIDSEGRYRTVPFLEMLYILSAGLIPKEHLDAEGYVRLSMGESRVKKTLAAIKIQRWVRIIANGESKSENENNEVNEREEGGEEEVYGVEEGKSGQLEKNRLSNAKTTAETSVNMKVGPSAPPSLSFDFVRSNGDAPPPRSHSMTSSTTSEGSPPSSTKMPLHTCKRRGLSDTHPLTGLKIPID